MTYNQKNSAKCKYEDRLSFYVISVEQVLKMGTEIREMSFQNVLDTILKPAGVKVGGYPDEIFTDLSEDEREEFQCNVCYLVLKETKECINKHMFCATCIFAWSMTYGANSDKCPVCRAEQKDYKSNKDIDSKLGLKRVKCPEEKCTFTSPLKFFLHHSHGKERYSNEGINLEQLKRRRPQPGPGVIILPMLSQSVGGLGPAMGLRSQLQQGRLMLHQMMMVMQIEMAMRSRALARLSAEQDHHARMQAMDEVVALNEQVDEIGTILGMLMSTPLREALQQGSSSSQGAATGTPRRQPLVRRSLEDYSDDSDSDSSDSSDSSIVSRLRLDHMRRRNDSVTRVLTSNGPANNSSTASNVSHSQPSAAESQRQAAASYYSGIASNADLRARRRSEIRDELLGSSSNTTSNASGNSTTTRSTLLSRRETEPAPLLRNSERSDTSSVIQSSTGRNESTTSQQTPSQNSSPRPTAASVRREDHTSENALSAVPPVPVRGHSTRNSSEAMTSTSSTSGMRGSSVSETIRRQMLEATDIDTPNGNATQISIHARGPLRPVSRSQTTGNVTTSRSSELPAISSNTSSPRDSNESAERDDISPRESSEDRVVTRRPPLHLGANVNRTSFNPQRRFQRTGANTSNEERVTSESQNVEQTDTRSDFPNSVFRRRLTNDSAQSITHSNAPLTVSESTSDASSGANNASSSQSQGSRSSRPTKYAPQKRFRRGSNSDNTTNSSRTGVSQTQPRRSSDTSPQRSSIRHTSQGANGNSVQRQTVSRANSQQRHSSDDGANNNSRRPRTGRSREDSGLGSVSLSTSSSTSSRLPTTPGQLLRARRRSEIQDDIRNLNRKRP